MYKFEIPPKRKSEPGHFLGRSTLPHGSEYCEIKQHYRVITEKNLKEEERYQKELWDYLTVKKITRGYSQFLNQIEKILSVRLPTQFYLFYDGKTLYTFYSYSFGKNIKLLTKYRDDNANIFKYFVENILTMNASERNFLHFEANTYNNFSFFTSMPVLRILLKKCDIESRKEELFSKFKKKSKNGKIRDIIAPHEEIKKELRNLNEILQRVYDRRNIDFQIAYKKKKNVKDGAKLHINNKYVYNIDLKDFYPSCKRELVKRYTDFLFSFTLNREFIENEFFSVILMDDGLFIGSPISGVLANTIISGPVLYLKNICKNFGIEISVYADDISFSSNKFISKEFILKIFEEAFTKYNLNQYFNLNEKKCKGFSGMHRKITGVSINQNDDITVSRRYFRELRTKIAHLGNGDDVNIQKLRGQIAYALMIDESGKVKKYLNKFNNIVSNFNLCSQEKLLT